MLTKRLALTTDEVNKFSQSLVAKIRALASYQQAKVVGLYMPIKNEPDLTALLTDQKIFLLPKVKDLDLIYGRYHVQTSLIESSLGILEPRQDEDLSATLDMMIIPALALDVKGNRLGFGKGFFDRFLMHQRPAKVIGVIYPFQLVDKLMTSRFDVPVDEVLIAD